MSDLTLYQGPRVWGLANASPFCIKVELFLRHHQIPYEVKRFHPTEAPRGKMPYIRLNGELIGDSERIIEALCARFNFKLDEHLTTSQKHTAHALRRMLEEGTYFICFWDRWLRDENWSVIKKAYFGELPWGLRDLIPAILRRQVRRTCYGQGVSRYSPEELSALLDADLSAVGNAMSDVSDGPFFFGEHFSKLDATTYAWLASLLGQQLPNTLACLAKDSPQRTKFQSYVDRLTQTYFPEFGAHSPNFQEERKPATIG